MMLEAHPFADLFPMLDGAAFEALVADIRREGLHEPIVLLDRQILDGRNRYAAAIAAGRIGADEDPYARAGGPDSDLFREFQPGEGDPLAFVLSKNLHRRHLDTHQRALIAARIANLSPGGIGGQPANLPDDAPAPVSQAKAAALLAVSPRSLRDGKTVLDRGAPALVAAVEAGKLAVNEAAKAARLAEPMQLEIAALAEAGKANATRTIVKKHTRIAREAALGAKQRALPEKRYGLIYADPEWTHETWSELGKDRAADNHYPVSGEAAIAGRDVASIAAEDCICLLWTTDLARGIRVLEAWGFEFKSYLSWTKDIVPCGTDEQGRRLFVEIGPAGTGFWFRDRDEILLVGTRGKVPCPAMGTQCESVLFAARPRDEDGHVVHSAKPDDVYAWAETHFPTLPKIELNARKRRDGWEAWGLEAPPSAPNEASDEAEAPDLAAAKRERTEFPDGHVVHMSLESADGQTVSLARCDCGWTNRVPWPEPGHGKQDGEIEAHWQAVEAGENRA